MRSLIARAYSALLDLISTPASPAQLAARDRPLELHHLLWPWTRYGRKRRR